MSRPYDVIVWGATGFTGKLVAEYLTTSTGKEVKFAIAGRSKAKLQQVSAACIALDKQNRFPSGQVPMIIADSADVASLDKMLSQGRAVITTVGPYAKYGFELVESCIRNKCDYVDLCGEPQFIRQIIDKYHDDAVKNNVRICNACGFDSIPSDLGTFLITDYFKSKGLQTSNVRYAVKKLKGTASGGTLASAMNMIESLSFKELYQLQSNPDYLVPASIPNGKIWSGTTLVYDKGFQAWLAPFVMEATNLRLVRRSNGLLDYGSQFQYREGTAIKNFLQAFIMAFAITLGGLFILFPPVRWGIGKIMPPGTGPSESVRKNGFFKVELIGEATDNNGKTLTSKVTVFSKGDPGYQATSMMIAESALCLALDKERLEKEGETGHFKPARGGIVTPAAAMGHVLIERLRKAGMTFDLTNE